MKAFALGLIEGFYGRQWSWSQRTDMVRFLARAGYSHYIYAPKGDRALRGDWRKPFHQQWLNQLNQFAAHCRAEGLSWGIGLSPMGLQQAYGIRDRDELWRRLDQLESLRPDTLWLLFDDMRGDHAALAENHCRISADVAAHFSGELAVCPSYYSFDPILDEVFGPRPPDYLADLSRGLASDVQLLWTGDKVLSQSLGPEACERFSKLTGRRALLWDNYPVNDGRKTSRYLHLNAFTERSPDIKRSANGHFVNPMNQAELSKLSLLSLPQVYTQEHYDADAARKAAFATLPAKLALLLRRDWQHFQQNGLDAIGSSAQAGLLKDYSAIDHPAAAEVAGWLKGDYAFDPACLTDV